MDALSPLGQKAFNRRKTGMDNKDTKVNVSLGYTLNLGNFQSLRIDLGVEDSRRDGESIQEAFDRVYGFVETRLSEKVKEAAAEIDN